MWNCGTGLHPARATGAVRRAQSFSQRSSGRVTSSPGEAAGGAPAAARVGIVGVQVAEAYRVEQHLVACRDAATLMRRWKSRCERRSPSAVAIEMSTTSRSSP
jgi:hypothetical protein